MLRRRWRAALSVVVASFVLLQLSHFRCAASLIVQPAKKKGKSKAPGSAGAAKKKVVRGMSFCLRGAGPPCSSAVVVVVLTNVVPHNYTALAVSSRRRYSGLCRSDAEVVEKPRTGCCLLPLTQSRHPLPPLQLRFNRSQTMFRSSLTTTKTCGSRWTSRCGTDGAGRGDTRAAGCFHNVLLVVAVFQLVNWPFLDFQLRVQTTTPLFSIKVRGSGGGRVRRSAG